MKLSSVILAPYWLGQLFTGAKSFIDNPILGSSRLNRWGLHVARVKAAHRMTERRRARLASAVFPIDRTAFDRDGVVQIHNFLPDDQFRALQAQVRAYRGAARETVQGDTVTRRMAFDPSAKRAIPAFEHFRTHPRWRALGRYIAGFDMEPLLYLQSVLPNRHEAAPDPQLAFHADTFHPSMKAWLFLEDVAPEHGPFAYVKGSHRLSTERLAWEKARSLSVRDGDCRLSARGSFRVSKDDMARMGLPEPTLFSVPANTLVVADTVGFHARTQSTVLSTRVEIWAYARRNPFLPMPGLDFWSLTGLADRRIGFRWWLGDRINRFVRHSWRDVGIKGAADD